MNSQNRARLALISKDSREHKDLMASVKIAKTWAMKRAQGVPDITPYGFFSRPNRGCATGYGPVGHNREDEDFRNSAYPVLVLKLALRHFSAPGIGDGLTKAENEKAIAELRAMLVIASRAHAKQQYGINSEAPEAVARLVWPTAPTTRNAAPPTIPSAAAA